MEKNELQVDIKKLGSNEDCVLIRLSGIIEAQEIPYLNDSTRSFVNKANSIILDLNNVKSISSLGLKYVVRLYSIVKNLKIVLNQGNTLVYDILNHAGIMKIIKIYNTEDEAKGSN